MDRPTENPETWDARAKGAGRNLAEYAMSAEAHPWVKDNSNLQIEPLLEKVVDSENMQLAWKQVRRNKGAPGIDERTIEETKVFLREGWPEIRRQLLDGTYTPLPVKRIEIPKP